MYPGLTFHEEAELKKLRTLSQLLKSLKTWREFPTYLIIWPKIVADRN